MQEKKSRLCLTDDGRCVNEQENVVLCVCWVYYFLLSAFFVRDNKVLRENLKGF